MNPNMMYGQQMPMQPPPPQRRHDGSYAPMPGQMRHHPGYQPYYHPQMGPMMPPYPQQYPPNWYPYQPNAMHHQPMHQGRGYQNYPPAPPMQPYPQHHGPIVVSHPHAQPSPRPMHQQMPPPTNSRPSSGIQANAVPSTVPVQTPPSPPLSTPGSTVAQQERSSRTSTPAAEPVQPVVVEPARPSTPYYPPLPWISVDDESFPKRAAPRKRKIARSLLAMEPIVFPRDAVSDTKAAQNNSGTPLEEEVVQDVNHAQAGHVSTPTQSTALTSDVPSDAGSTQPTTPSSAVAPQNEKFEVQRTPTQAKAHRATKSVIPAVPILPQSPIATKRSHRDSMVSTVSKSSSSPQPPTAAPESASLSATEDNGASSPGIDQAAAPLPPPVAAVPKSWADLVRKKSILASPNTAPTAAQIPNGLGVAKTESLSDVLNEMNLTENEPASKVALLEPRGLVNTGNMCYMNSVLQMLVFCIPFYDFLQKLSLRAPHTFKSDTPLIDAMIMFMREYPTIDSATSVDKLRLRLKQDDFEKYGEAFIPEYVYQVIRQLPRFRDMRRGHQQDAQEFLGFLLEELHEECANAMRRGTSVSSGRSTPIGSASNISEPTDNDSGWMEVGHKQKPSVTRSSGAIQTESPITNIFGGKLRSELKVAGNKLSVTLEPYQPLQLDIGSPQVTNIIEALKGLTKPESMQGDFQSARGMKGTATKQVFIETLPPVLILHLKRFHYDNSLKRAEKIWKKVGYPLELEIPKDVFPVQVRNKMAAHGGLPKYRLIGVIYHHGKNANGGHYTVDLRRQDGNEWIRMDDTVIRRIRSEDVAEGGSEEDPKILAAALERHKQQKTSGNRFEQIEEDGEEDENNSEKLWSQVNGHSRTKSAMNTVINGSATPASSGPQTPSQKFSVKDNKVAYLLFYQRTSP